MLPTVLIGPVALPTYPLSLLLALWAGLWLAAWRARELALDSDHMYNAGLYSLIAGIVGARLWFVLAHWENYAPNLWQAFSLSRSALSAGEGVVIAGLAALIYLQRHRVNLGDFFDAAAPGLALAMIIGYLGALLGGQDLGQPTTLPWAVSLGGAARHPVPLYEAGAGLFVLIILLFNRTWRPWPGIQFWSWVILASFSRLVFEIFRARPYVIGDGYLALQMAALAAIIVALVVMAYNFTGTMSSQNH